KKRGPQGRRAAGPAHPGKAAGPEPRHLVAQGRHRCAARRLRPGRRARRNGRIALRPHGLRRIAQDGDPGGARNRQVPEKSGGNADSPCFAGVRTHFSEMKWERAAAPPVPGTVNDGANSDDLAPPAWGRVREVAWHLPRLLSGLGPLGPRGPEDGPPALVIPRFLGTDRKTMELRRALARAGWRAHPWLLGLNTGAKKNTIDLLCERLKDL